MMDGNTPTKPAQSPVDRQRRYYFIARIVSFCLITSAIYVGVATLMDWVNPLVTDFVDGLLAMANMVTLAYISGSVIDYNGALAGMLSKRIKE